MITNQLTMTFLCGVIGIGDKWHQLLCSNALVCFLVCLRTFKKYQLVSITQRNTLVSWQEGFMVDFHTAPFICPNFIISHYCEQSPETTWMREVFQTSGAKRHPL